MAMLSHRQGWSFAVVPFVIPFVFLARAANDSPMATYHTNASEVRVAFFTTDENNHLVESVVKDDFAVVDGGMVIRNFRSLTRSNETALDVVAVVDASESVSPRFQTTMNDVLQLVSQKSLANDDNISVMTFSGLRPILLCARDCRSPSAGQRLRAVKASGPTPLFDALAYVADFISSRRAPGVRQVLILFSDGNDTISMISAHDALKAVVASGALLYAVDLNQSRDASNGSALLQRMAEATGGRSFSVQEGAVNVLQAALADLRASYVVTYPLPSRAAGFHSLRILPKHNLNLRFHCRSGYYYEESIR
jgi:VWFA-related protein